MAVSTSDPRLPKPQAAPTIRQVYALAGALCERLGEEFPATRAQASETIERLRRESGHPAPRLQDCPPRRRRRRRRPYPWWQHLRPREEEMEIDAGIRRELVREAQERLRSRLAVETETTGAAQALIDQLTEQLLAARDASETASLRDEAT